MAGQWYVECDGKQVGPLTDAQVKQMADDGRLQPTSLIWKEGLAEWQPASSVKGLFAPKAASSPRSTVTAANPTPATTSPPPPAAEPTPKASSQPQGSAGVFNRLGEFVKGAITNAQVSTKAAPADPTSGSVNLTPKQKRNLLLAGGGVFLLMIAGCGGLLLLVVFAPEKGQKDGNNPSRDVTIEGDTAKVVMVIHHGAPFIDNLKTTAYNVGVKVHQVAEENPTVNKIEVHLKMSKQGVSDQYGKEWTEDRDMGVVHVENVGEVRKYISSGIYASNSVIQTTYMIKIKSLNHSHLLTR